jgi:hypothetical protein
VRILYSSSLLCSSNPALRLGPVEPTFNGQPVIDAWQALGADFFTVYGRGDGPDEFSFGVWHKFSSEAEVIAFKFGHRQSLPVQADLTVTDDAETVAWTMADAVRSVRIAQVMGLSVLAAYTFTGSRFESDDVPGAPTDSDTVKAINQALTSGTVEQAIAFDTAFASAPRGITLQLSAPDGGAMFGWQIRESTRTAAGFTVDFDAAVPAAGYKLTGIAVL